MKVTSPIADIIIPIAPYHVDKLDAIDSAHAQTIPVNVIEVMDYDKRGPAWARNAGIKQSRAPFIVFLDADDVIAPDFVARCLNEYKLGHYVYTNWQTEQAVHRPESSFDIFADGMSHTITTLLPRKSVEYIRGFDESLPGMEDIDLYMRLHQIGMCGIHLDLTLLTYNRNDGNSPVSPGRPKAQVAHWLQDFYRILRTKHANAWGATMCNCKDGNDVSNFLNMGGPEDVLVQAVNHARIIGPVTGHDYGKPNGHNMIKIHRSDAEALEVHVKAKKRVRILPNPAAISPDVNTVLDLLNTEGGAA